MNYYFLFDNFYFFCFVNPCLYINYFSLFQSEDTDTGRDADESIESAVSDAVSNGIGYAREDTLETWVRRMRRPIKRRNSAGDGKGRREEFYVL